MVLALKTQGGDTHTYILIDFILQCHSSLIDYEANANLNKLFNVSHKSLGISL